MLTLSVSTTTTECAFFLMKLVKTRLRNKIEDDFLASYMITYIEKDIIDTSFCAGYHGSSAPKKKNLSRKEESGSR